MGATDANGTENGTDKNGTGEEAAESEEKADEEDGDNASNGSNSSNDTEVEIVQKLKKKKHEKKLTITRTDVKPAPLTKEQIGYLKSKLEELATKEDAILAV